MGGLLESLKAGFDALPAPLVETQGLGAARRAALESALADGLPGARVEAWKYTSLRALSARGFSAPVPVNVDAAVVAGIAAPRLVFVNGRYDAALSDRSDLPDGVELRPMSEALGGDDPRAVSVFGRRFEHAPTNLSRDSTPRWPWKACA